MPSGGVLRQALRLIATASVRHILTARVLRPDSAGQIFEPHANPKNEAIYEFVKGAIESVGVYCVLMNFVPLNFDFIAREGRDRGSGPPSTGC